jgi:hypothetical protein
MAKVYLSGPITGVPEWREAFRVHRLAWQAAGHEVWSPADDGLPEEPRYTWCDYLRHDLRFLSLCEAMVVIPGWQKSRGCVLEIWLASLLMIPIYDAACPVSDLSSARKLMVPHRFFDAVWECLQLHASKGHDYGNEEDSLANIRASQRFGIAAWLGAVLRANDKMSRIASFAKRGQLLHESVRDSLIDLATYALIAVALYDENTQERLLTHPG